MTPARLVSRDRALVIVAAALSATLVSVYLAAGGASYTPVATQDPCRERPWRDPGNVQQIAEQFSLSALDGAACQLGVTRETLARALATPRTRERFMQRHGIDDAELARALRAGLLRAIDDAERAGVLSPLIAGPLRDTVRDMPLDQAIDLIRDGRVLLDSLQTFLDPAQRLLEGLLR